ncbi:MAG TPA: cache domain-containing protein [Rhodocyclaceae bacterium]
MNGRAKPLIRLRPSIVSLYLLLAIPLLAATIWLSYATNDRIARETADKLIEKARFETFNNTLNLLDPVKSIVKVAASLGTAQPDFFRQDKSAVYLTEMLAQSPYINGVYVAFPDGSFRMSLVVDPAVRILERQPPGPARVAQRWLDRAGGRAAVDRYVFFDKRMNAVGRLEAPAAYDPRLRPWFKETVAAGRRLTISDPYIFATTGLAGVTIAMPFYGADGALAGVIAADITLEALSKFLASRPVSENSISLIVDRNDRIVAHPDPGQSVRREDGKLVQNSLSRLSSDLPALAVASRMDKSAERFTFVHGVSGQEYVAMFSHLPDTLGKSWWVMIIAPLDDFSRQWTDNNRRVLLFGSIAVILEVLLIGLLSKLISRPIEQLERQILRIENFEPREGVEIKSGIREIRSLVQAVKTLDSTIDAFAAFVPRQLVRKLLGSDQRLELGGRSRFLTIFFSDLESFSTLAENSPAQELLTRVSAYLEAVTHAVNAEAGTIDKFIGDGVMAFWGAPELLNDHAYRACVAAMRVLRGMQRLNEEWARQGLGPLHVRIGIHSDSVLVGNIGSSERMSYTVMGDGVNIASRLEGLNKEFGTRVCVSHAVFKEAGERLHLRPLDVVTVKGRRAGLEVYELVGIRGDAELDASPQALRLCELTRAAYAAYRDGDPAAASLYRVVLAEFPGDPVATAMLARCGARTEASGG